MSAKPQTPFFCEPMLESPNSSRDIENDLPDAKGRDALPSNYTFK